MGVGDEATFISSVGCVLGGRASEGIGSAGGLEGKSSAGVARGTGNNTKTISGAGSISIGKVDGEGRLRKTSSRK